MALPSQASPVACGDGFHPPVETGGIKIGRIKPENLDFTASVGKTVGWKAYFVDEIASLRSQ